MDKIFIPNTKFNIDFILDKINEKLKENNENKLDINELDTVKITDLTNGSAFFSTVYRIDFKWKNLSINLNSIVIKIPEIRKMGKNDEIRAAAALDYLEFCHLNEVNLYKFLHNSSKKHLISMNIPKFYYGYKFSKNNNDGILIIENMSYKGKILKVLPGLNNEQIESCIYELAKLHVLGWKDNNFVQIKDERTTWKSFVKVAENIAKQIRLINPDFIPLMDIIDNIFNMNFVNYGFYKGEKYGFPSTLVHSDLWASNLIFKKDDKDNPTNDLLGLIDWQGCHSGNPMTDISRLLMINTTSEYRRNNTKRLIQFYYKIVQKLMNFNEPFTLNQLYEAYDYGLCFSSIFAAFGLPTLMEIDVIVGNGDDRINNQNELINRFKTFFEDTVNVIHSKNIQF